MPENGWLTGLPVGFQWFTLRDMTGSDLRAVYRYVKSLGPTASPRRRTSRPNAGRDAVHRLGSAEPGDHP